MKHLGISYSDVRKMPVRYRSWYIDRYIKSLNDEAEHRKKMTDSQSNKSSRSF
jgi:hypothetical protein